ncbi:helix-turn-helix domain-containing protein [Mongoliitalea daihaiensis]|uniref:helix-turn-helix domain-containing protein n=1 Tax=Mongoliitalea daihaiensis TaxID=2782006 RepID=UPI001F20FCB6|nr:helix-turn-helix domain-containing protein [Mongoliitalea daihaiensis]UJP65223.1 AraC family transcriptional regulator [Mongoliitalea daihaiensis]
MEKASQHESKVLEKINEALNNDELITDPELNLHGFAKAIDFPARTVSNIINKYWRKGFRALIAPYRVRKAISLMKSGKKKKLHQIGKEAGFNSRTTFFTSFKQELGICPREFIKNISTN